MWPGSAEVTGSGSKLAITALALMVLIGSCREPGSIEDAATPASGASSPGESVETLIDALDSGDFSEAAPLAMPEHVALASLAEGATFGEVADVLRAPDSAVVENFWAGFAQGAGSFLLGTEVAGAETMERDGVEYQVVTVVGESGAEREMVTRDLNGFRIDLFASFAPGLAERMVGPVERLLAAQTDDSRLVLSRLRDVVPSLLVAAERPGQPVDVVQSILRLVELITRVG